MPVELHSHMHGRDCDVCRVLIAFASIDPIETTGRPGGEAIYLCRYCKKRQRWHLMGGELRNRHTHHDDACAWWTACALVAIQNLRKAQR